MTVRAVLSVVALGICGCAGALDVRHATSLVEQAPRPERVPVGQVVARASRAAAEHEGDFVLLGVGRSMEPVYFSGTVVVVHPTAVHMLRKGMAVVYANRRGAPVAHILVEKHERGWLAIGLNNLEPDQILVTEQNLMGIVRRAFVADVSSASDVVAVSPVWNETPRNGPLLALR